MCEISTNNVPHVGPFGIVEVDVARVAPGVPFDSCLHLLLLRPVDLQKEPRLH